MRALDHSAERLDRMLDVLVDAGRALASAPNTGAALARVADSLVRDVAQWCAIDVSREALGEDGLQITAGILPDVETAERFEEPLTDGRTELGRIICVAPQGGFDEFARRVVRVLALELGIVLAGATVMNRERLIADRLQRALLPEQLPTIAGSEFHAAYRPAGDEAEVGGDWFDAFALPDGRVAVSIGDVAGHGLDAAVIMGEVRQAMRTAAVAASSPAEVLDYVNRIVGIRHTIGFVTGIFGIYDPASGVISYSVAGHPPPLLVLANGLVRRFPGGNFPLGCSESLEGTSWTFTLPAGSHVVFYTDGLVENDRDLIAGELRLIESVRAILAGDAPRGDIALAILERVFAGDTNRDDAAVLVLSRNAPVADYEFSAVPVTAAIARCIVDEALQALGVDPERRFGIVLAVSEAIANAIEHAYRDDAPGLVRLELSSDGAEFAATIEDFGRWRPFVRRGERGRGIELMHAFTDSVQIRSTRESTRILLRARYGS